MFCDPSYEHIRWVCDLALARLKAGGMVLVPDVDWNAGYGDFCAARGVEPFMFEGRVGVLRC